MMKDAPSGIWPFFLALICFGCASTQNELLTQWQGKPSDKLIAEYGPPTSEKSSGPNRTVLAWQKPQRHSSGIGRMGHAESYYAVCVREFEVDSAGLVKGASERGYR
jgi:hypothetical protein